MNDTVLMIAVSETKARMEGKEYPSLEAKLEAAMELTKDHWMVTDEDGRFKAAIGAVLVTSNDEEKERIEQELSAIKALSAMFAGVPVDLSNVKAPEKPLRMMDMWRKVNGKAR